MQRLSQMGDLVEIILDTIPAPIFVVDEDVQILGCNQAVFQMLAQEPELVIRRRAGEVLHCLHATEVPEGCGRSGFCGDCLIRNSVREAVQGRQVVRKRARVELLAGGTVMEAYLLVTTGPLVYRGQTLVLLILEDISELMELKKILPICAHCKRVRNDQEFWQSVETYFKEHLDLDFSHGICPECAQEFYRDFSGEKH